MSASQRVSVRRQSNGSPLGYALVHLLGVAEGHLGSLGRVGSVALWLILSKRQERGKKKNATLCLRLQHVYQRTGLDPKVRHKAVLIWSIGALWVVPLLF